MTCVGTPSMSMKAWSNIVWDRAWKIEDANWRATNVIFKDNNLWKMTIGKTRYLAWRYLSDMDYRLVRMCEAMSKSVCHASLLKHDDPRLKRLSMSNRTSIACDMYCVEDIFHVIMQCPAYQEDRTIILVEITRKCPNAKEIFRK